MKIQHKKCKNTGTNNCGHFSCNMYLPEEPPWGGGCASKGKKNGLSRLIETAPSGVFFVSVGDPQC